MKINLILLCHQKVDDDKQLIHSRSDNIEITINKETNKAINYLFELLLRMYQVVLKESKKGSDLIYHSVDGMHCKSNKISLACNEPLIESPDWMEKEKTNINSKN